ncbi:hypothetical protein [Aureimonas sp. AU40]|uniref:hypothetical protein n=1 Tax=Aureimonas sp. AU40 TaxID=1637747 RepID=UPI0007856179|nr:hypothetical protein [Aureimonas sp. AU40]
MVVAFPADVRERLARIEAVEGVPALDLIHQAVAVWSQLDAGERRRLGQVAIGIVMERARKGGAR